MVNEGVEALERALVTKKNEVLALEQALAILKGGSVSAENGSAPSLIKGEFEGLGITEATVKLLQERKVPMDTRTISDALLDGRIRTRSKNFVATVYATLTNAKEFRRTKDAKWELVEGR